MTSGLQMTHISTPASGIPELDPDDSALQRVCSITRSTARG
jgi:hypothetical protein